MHQPNVVSTLKARRWLLLAVAFIPVFVSACSLSSVPLARPTPTAGVAQSQPTAGTTPQQAQPTQAAGSNQTAPGTQGAPWQIPAEQQAVVKVVEQISPAVVTVVNRLDPSQGFSGEARGSGVIIDNQGRIITNNHVVEGAASGGLQVIFYNGDTAQAELLGADTFSDIAVLKVDGQMPGFANLGDSSKLKVGETVIAIGSALGDFQNTVTVGVVSGLNRTLKNDNGTNMENMIQT